MMSFTLSSFHRSWRDPFNGLEVPEPYL